MGGLFCLKLAVTLSNGMAYLIAKDKGGIKVLEIPLSAKLLPVALAGMIALSPINPEHTAETLEAAKQKIVTIIHKEGYTTTIDQNGEEVKLPYKEKITVEKPEDNKRGFISRTISGTITGTLDICKDVYWWVKK